MSTTAVPTTRRSRPSVGETLVRAVLGSTGVARELTEADAVLRRPVSTSRRIAVVGVQGGTGATTLTARMAALLAGRRGGGVLAVDASRGDAALAAALGVPEPLPLARSLGRTAGAATAAAARQALPRAAFGTGTSGRACGASVLGAGTQRGDEVVTPQGWRAAVDPVSRFFDVVLTDWGVRGERDLAEVVEVHHAVLLVARADRPRAEEALDALATVLALVTPSAGGAVPGGEGVAAAFRAAADGVRVRVPAPAVGLVLVDLGGTAGPTGDLVRDRLAALGVPVPVHVVPHDAVLARGVAAPVPVSRRTVPAARRRHAEPLALGTRLAVARLAAGTLDLAVGS